MKNKEYDSLKDKFEGYLCLPNLVRFLDNLSFRLYKR